MDLDYLRRRQEEERVRAANADSDAARKAHEELAAFFDIEIAKAIARQGKGQSRQAG